MLDYRMDRATDCPRCAGTHIVVYPTKRFGGTCRPCKHCVPRDSPDWFRAGRRVMGYHQCSLLVSSGYAAWVDTYLAPVVASMWAAGFNTMSGCQGGHTFRADGKPMKPGQEVLAGSGYLGGHSPGWLEHLRTLIDPARYIEIERQQRWGAYQRIIVRWEGSLL